jgi:hypothetical protein
MLRTVGGRPGARCLIVSYFFAAKLAVPGEQWRWRHREDFAPAGAGYELCKRSEPHSVGRRVTHPADVAAQHRVLVPEYKQLSNLRPVPAEQQDSEAV